MPRFFKFPKFPHATNGRIQAPKATPVLLVAFVLPSDRRRREKTAPLFWSSIKALSGITALFIPQIPIPDTSKFKNKLIEYLPSWTTLSATSPFIKRPQADIVVSLTFQMRSFSAIVVYYTKGQEIVLRSVPDDEDTDEPGSVLLRPPDFRAVDGWVPSTKFVSTTNYYDGIMYPAVVRYTTSYPHQPIGVSIDLDETRLKRYDPDRPWFYAVFSDFLFADDSPVINRQNMPLTFQASQRQLMTDYARLIREHLESFIASEILDKATIVNETPLIKYMITYPDVLDGLENESGLTRAHDFFTALKDAGYPLLESEIPRLPMIENDLTGNYGLKSLDTTSQMVEFLSNGFAGLIGYSFLLPSNPQKPVIPEGRPFMTVVEDASYFSTRLCHFTSDARFGVAQYPFCSTTRSPVFQRLPEEHINLLRSFFITGIDYFSLEDEEWERWYGDPALKQLVYDHAITEWPENKAWKDVLDVFHKRFDKPSVELETDPYYEYADTIYKVTTTPLGFVLMVLDAIFIPIGDSLGPVFLNVPSMKHIVLFDTGRGEADAYKAVFNFFLVPKDAPSDAESSAPSAPDSDPWKSRDKAIIDGINWPGLVARTKNVLSATEKLDAGVEKTLDDSVRLNKSYDVPFDYDKYYSLSVVRPQDHGVTIELGVCDAALSELVRIFAEALRL